MNNTADEKLIDQIVVEVLAQLRQRMESAPTSPATPRESDNKSINHKSLNNRVILPDAVVTEEVLKQHARPGMAVHVAPKAIITPSARDYIKFNNLSIERTGYNDAAVHRSSLLRGTIIAAHLPEVVQSFLSNVKQHSQSLWNVEIESGAQDVVSRALSVICRGESPQALVLVKNPHHVACLVNRNAQCRAAVVQSGGDVRRVRNEFGANVICADLVRPTFVGLRNVLRACGQTAELVREPKGSGA